MTHFAPPTPASYRPEFCASAGDATALLKRYLRQFELAKSDVQRAMRLSPRDPAISQWHNFLADVRVLGSEISTRRLKKPIRQLDGGYRVFYALPYLAAAHALKVTWIEARAALAEARRINPKLSIKWLTRAKPVLQPAFDGLRKAGLTRRTKRSPQMLQSIAPTTL